MENRSVIHSVSCAIFIATGFSFAAQIGAAAETGTFLTGKAAMGDWRSDATGVRRKITFADLPPPSSNFLAIKRSYVVDRSSCPQLRMPPGFRNDRYECRSRHPCFLFCSP